MRSALHIRRIILVLICAFIIFGISITALASYQNKAYDFSINGISPKVEGSYYESIPVADFTAEVSITNKGSATSIMVLLATYAENGQMIQAQYQTKTFGANETSVCAFKVNNVDGKVFALKAFLLNSEKELIPVARSFSLSNLDMVVFAYVNDEKELIVRTGSGEEFIVNTAEQKGNSFSDYEIGTKFYLEYPKGEFDIPVVVNGKEYTIHVSEVYYELTAIKDTTDDSAWTLTRGTAGSTASFTPFNGTMNVQAVTSPELVGAKGFFFFGNSTIRFMYPFVVAENGTITVCYEQNLLSPVGLYFQELSLAKTE